MATLTMLDLAKLTGHDKVVGLIEENLAAAPEMAVLPARTIRGTSYKTSLRITYPDVGFRAVNASTTAGKSAFETKTVSCFVLSSLITIDKALAQAYEDGEDMLKAIEASGVMKQAMIETGQQVFYGTGTTLGAVGNASGFPGLVSIAPAGMTIDAAGTTTFTGSSVYAVKTGAQDVQMVFGNGIVTDLSPWRVETVSGVPSHVADLTGWVGLQCVNPNSVGRIKKLTADSGKGLTDSLIADLLATFPVGSAPNYLFMTRRSRLQLQKSRSIILSSGNPNNTSAAAANGSQAGVFAGLPTEAFGIPIITTDSLVDVEGLTL